MKLPFHRLLLSLLAVCLGAAAACASVVQADLVALTRASSALVALTAHGDLQRSTTNGASFATTRVASGSTLLNLAASTDTVVAVGDAGFIVRSANGGQTWAAASSPAFTGELRDAAANGTFWVAVGRKNFNVIALWSADGGATWTEGTLPTTGGTLHGIAYDASATRWTAVGGDMAAAKIFTSTDGKNWFAVTAPLGTSPLRDVVSDGNGRVLAVGEAGTLLVSVNGGQSFVTDANSGLLSETLNVVAYSSATGFVAGGDDFVQVTYTAASGAGVSQTPVPGGGDIVALAFDANGAPVIAGNLAGYQTITFASPGDQSFAVGAVMLTATASSGLPVTFELVDGPATINGAVVTFVAPGAVTVRATQPGDASFLTAASVTRSFTVTAAGAGFEMWRAQNFTTTELQQALSAPGAVASSDGLPNLLKYALGLVAKTPAVAPFELSATATEFVLTYTHQRNLGDVTLQVEMSTDLVQWTTTGVTSEQISSTAETETWQARYTRQQAPHAFFRVRATRVGLN